MLAVDRRFDSAATLTVKPGHAALPQNGKEAMRRSAKIGAVFVGCLELTACTGTRWDKAGATKADYDTDSHQCQKYTLQGEYFGTGFHVKNTEWAYDRCMMEHGWAKRTE